MKKKNYVEADQCVCPDEKENIHEYIQKGANTQVRPYKSNLPEGWQIVSLKEVAEINPKIDKSKISDKTIFSFVPMQAVGAGDGRIDTSIKRHFADVKKGYTPFQPHDVLFAKITPCMENGKIAVVPALHNNLGFGSTEFHVIMPKDGVDPQYIYYYVSRLDYRKEAASKMTGAVGQKRVPTDFIKSSTIPLAPLDQQKSIVAEIEKQFSRLDEAVTALKRIQTNLKRYKASVLKAAVEGNLTEEWRKQHSDVEPASELLKRILVERRKKWEAEHPGKKYKEPVPPETSHLPELLKGWIWATAEQLCDFITKGTTPSATKLYEGAGEVQFLKVYNLTFTGQLNYKYKPAYVSRATHEGELARSRVFPGDILINIVGPPLGQVSIVPEALPEANINQAIARFRMLSEMSGRYFAIVLMSKEVMGWAIKRAKTTAGQANLTLELCRALPVPLPPLSEQKNIVEEVEHCFSVTEEIEDTSVTNLKRAERLRQAILKKAFLGGLIRHDELTSQKGNPNLNDY